MNLEPLGSRDGTSSTVFTVRRTCLLEPSYFLALAIGRVSAMAMTGLRNPDEAIEPAVNHTEDEMVVILVAGDRLLLPLRANVTW